MSKEYCGRRQEGAGLFTVVEGGTFGDALLKHVKGSRTHRYNERHRRSQWREDRDELSEKRLRAQRRFVDLLPAREYAHIGNNRAVLLSGRVIAQQRMVRKLGVAYQKNGLARKEMVVKQVVQIGLNVRAAQAEALKRQAMVLQETFCAVDGAVRENPSLALEQICGVGEHRTSREPYFHDFAYGRTVMRARKSGWTAGAAYASRQAGFVLKVATKIHVNANIRYRRLRKWVWDRVMQWRLDKFEVAHLQTYVRRVHRVRKLGLLGRGRASDKTWPCDPKLCLYPENAVRRLAGMTKLFANVRRIRSVIAENEIDACSLRGGCHKTWLTMMQHYSDRERRFVRLPIIRQLDKKGHPLNCLPRQCGSNLLFLRQLAVHFKLVAKIVRHIYLLMELDRRLCEIDRALVEADYGFLEQLASEHKGNLAELISKPLGEETKKVLAPEDQIPFLPFTKLFEEGIMERMEYECSSCQCIFYRRGVKNIFVEEPKQRTTRLRPWKDMDPVLHVGGWGRSGPPWNGLWSQLYDRLKGNDPDVGRGGFYVCDECDRGLRSGQNFGPVSIFNDMDVDAVPDELGCLNEFEKCCIQRAKCFQMVCRLGAVGKGAPPSDRLKVVRGQVLYYPLPLSETIKQLEEAEVDAPTLQVIFNSVATRNAVVWQQLLNLEKVKRALQWLRANNALYKHVESDRWVQRIEAYLTEKSREEEADSTELPKDVLEICEDLAIRGALVKPMLWKLGEGEQERILESCTIHPLEPIRPNLSDLQIFQMKRIEAEKFDNRYRHLDLACFPVLYARGRFGQGATRKVPVDSIKYVKARLMNRDPRWRRDHQFIFHALWNYELRQVAQGINQLLRNRRRYDELTVKDFLALADGGDEALECNVNAMFQSMRGSPEYWKGVKQELLCMIREIGPPTFFLTLSANEYHWTDMEHALKFANSDLPNVDKLRTSTLCAIDPVTTQEQFHHRFTQFFNNVILHRGTEGGPLGVVWDYFWRIEYQARGMPHYHCLLWIKDAPQKGKDDDNVIKSFIRKYATCELPDPDNEPLLHNLVTTYQVHGCNRYCYRKVSTKKATKTVCRFGFPRRARRDIHLREALSSIAQRSRGAYHKRFYELPRREVESRINDYNATVLLYWKGNMDIQFIGESSVALANYVCGYVTKAESSSTEMWEDIDANRSVWKQLYRYAFRKLANRECGLIEATDRLRSQPLYYKTRETVYINAKIPSERSVSLKPYKTLLETEAKDQTSTSKYEANYIDDYYPKRPRVLEDTCYYDFRKYYDKCKNPEKSMRFLGNTEGVQMRNDPYLISHTIYKKADEVEKYRYSLLLLFKPFREEAVLLDGEGKCSSIFLRELEVNQLMAAHHVRLQAQLARVEAADEEARKAVAVSLSASAEEVVPLDVAPAVNDAVEELFEAMVGGSGDEETSVDEDVAQMNENSVPSSIWCRSGYGILARNWCYSCPEQQGVGKAFSYTLCGNLLNKCSQIVKTG